MYILKRYPNLRSDKRIVLTLYLTIIGLFFLFITGCVSLYNENIIVSAILFSTFICAIANLYLLSTKYFDSSRYGLAVLAGFIAFSLLASGGQEATGHLWTYPIVAIVISVLSVKESIVFSSIFLVFAAVMLYFANECWWLQEYEITTARRYWVSMLALICISNALIYIQEETSKLLAHQTVTDNLTGVYNRAVLDRRKLNMLERTGKNCENYVLLLDVDLFKNINDSYGHNVGDQVLMHLGHILRSQVRTDDLAIRWGGEEFLLVLKNCPKKNALYIADEIKNKFEHNQSICELLGKPATISIGMAELTLDKDFNFSVERADERLYQAKQNGRNRIVHQ